MSVEEQPQPDGSRNQVDPPSPSNLSRRGFLAQGAAGVGAVSAAVAIETNAAAAEGDPNEPAHFHHLHLNSTNPEASRRYYQFMYGATPVRFRGVQDAVFTERSFIFTNRVQEPPPSELESGIWHIGWGGVDIPNEFLWWKSQGMRVHTDIYPLGTGHVTYWSGPDNEVIEINTMGHHRYAHVHLFAADVNVTAEWYTRHLGLRGRRTVPKPKDMSTVRAWSNGFRCDNVSFGIYGMPDYTPSPPWWRWEPLKELKPQTGRAIDHFAFSYRNIEPVFERMRADGVEIVRPIRFDEDYQLKSFYVMAPDQVMVEIVEAKPIPEGVWDA